MQIAEWADNPVTKRLLRQLNNRLEEYNSTRAYTRGDPYQTLSDNAETQGAVMAVNFVIDQVENVLEIYQQEKVDEAERREHPED